MWLVVRHVRSCLAVCALIYRLRRGAMEALSSGEISRIIRTHVGKGTLVSGWEEVQARLVECGLAWKVKTPPECQC